MSGLPQLWSDFIHSSMMRLMMALDAIVLDKCLGNGRGDLDIAYHLSIMSFL